MPHAAKAQLASGPTVDLTYEKIRLLGKGGWATVSEIRILDIAMTDGVAYNLNIQTGTTLALKRHHESPKFVYREPEVHALVSHPNIVEFLGYWVEQEKCTSEDGEAAVSTYHNILLSCYPLVLSELPLPIALQSALSYVRQILQALAYLHSPEISIFHRDVQITNILVDPSSGIVKLCDMGAAKKYVPGKWAAGTIGMSENRPLEISLQSNHYDFCVDIWPVGLILLHLLTGHHPFRRKETDMQQLIEIASRLGRPTAEEISEANGTIPSNTLSWEALPPPDVDPVQARTMRLEDLLTVKPSAEVFPLLIQLLDHLLQYSPRRRCTSEQTIQLLDNCAITFVTLS